MNSARIEQLKKYLEESPDDPFLYYALALEFMKETPERSAEIFRKMLTDYPEYLPVYYHAANCFWELGSTDEARSAFETGIGLAEQQEDSNTLRELRNAYMNFQFDTE